MRILCALAATLMLLGATAVSGQESGDPAAGRKYAEANCAQCHAVFPDEMAFRPPEATAFKTIANTPGMNGIALTVWLRTSHPTMPDIVLKQDDIHHVIAYILSLKD